MLPRAYPGSTLFPPEEWVIRRVVSEREGLEQVRAALRALETEPSAWFAPSRDVYLQRLGALGDELGCAIAATDALAQQLEREQWQAQQQHVELNGQRALVVGL
jgi:hypothetical protein